MSDHAMLAILLVLGFIVLALAVMAILGWLLVLVFRARERRRGPDPAGKQSRGIANGLFQLAEIDDDKQRQRR